MREEQNSSIFFMFCNVTSKNNITMDFMEEYESVMATRDEWFTLRFMLTHLKRTEAYFR